MDYENGTTKRVLEMTKNENVSTGFIYIPEGNANDNFSSKWGSKIDEELKGDIIRDDNFKLLNSKEQEITEPHPFDFNLIINLYKEYGLLSGVIDKYVDFILASGFKISSKNVLVEDTLNKFIKEKNFELRLRPWVKDGLLVGNGFLEVANDMTGMPAEFKCLNPLSMYVKRDNKGNLLGFKQLVSSKMGDSMKLMGSMEGQGIDFTPIEVLHYKCNVIGDNAYGQGLVYSALGAINYLLKANKEKHLLLSRKANSPIHVKIGDATRMPTPEAVTAYGQKLHYMNNKTEWATDYLVDMKVLDFGNVSDKFAGIVDEDIKDFCYSLQIPEVILGKGSIPEGLATVQLEAFQRNIISKQKDIGLILKQNIFDKILLNKSIYDMDYVIEWGEQSENQRREEADRLVNMLRFAQELNPAIRRAVEKRFSDLMKLGISDEEIIAGEKQMIALKQMQQPFGFSPKQEQPQLEAPVEEPVSEQSEEVQQNVNLKKNLKPEHIHMEAKRYEDIIPSKAIKEEFEQDIPLKEWVGYDYDVSLKAILGFLKEYNFDDLAAETEADIAAGYLSAEQVEKLRKVYELSFKNGYSTKQITSLIKQNVGIKDLHVDVPAVKDEETGEEIIAGYKKTLPADMRAAVIAKNEAAVISFWGLLKEYRDYDIEKVVWRTTGADNVCDICYNLEDQEMDIDEAESLREGMHVNCHCWSTAVIEGLTNSTNPKVKEYLKLRGV